MQTNGVTTAYIPPERLEVADSLRMHTATAPADPITYEVLRHNLWNINDEHGMHIVKVSGSPIALYGQDFNPAICMEQGDIVFSGPFIQFMSGTADLMVKWTLEHRSQSPGIENGDMFLCCDPWIGAPHQPDNYLMCPVFVGEELFAWVVNTLHLHEIGGMTPGSFCPDAPDVFSEPTPIPPVKLVKGGDLQPDIEEMVIRGSRMPGMVALDLRSQIAGAHFARERIVALVERYGADLVKGVMKGIIDTAEASTATKLKEIPDGSYREIQYTGVALSGDRNAYRLVLTATKEGDSITFTNEGTDPAAGTLGCTFGGWRSGVLAAVNAILGYDQLFATGGVLRRLNFRPTHGTMTSANHPASVTMYSSILITSAMAARVVSKMVATSERLASDALGPSGFSNSLYTGFGGLDKNGAPFGTVTLDQIASGMSAFADRDGISTGGTWWVPQSSIANCEEIELSYPLLHLYRHEVHGGGGHGRWRGGDGIVIAWIPHQSSNVEFATTTAATVVPNVIGLSGGYPGATGGHFRVPQSDIWERFSRGEMIGDSKTLRELGGCEQVPPKLTGIPFERTDCLEMRCPSGGGFGDPLLREPERVAADMRTGVLNAGDAESFYGVVCHDDGTVDADRTAEARAALYRERLQGAGGDNNPSGDNGLMAKPLVRVHEHIGIFQVENGYIHRCLQCGQYLGELQAGYRRSLHVVDRPLTELGSYYVDPSVEVDTPLVARMLCCPGCGVLTDAEIALSRDEVYDDVKISARAFE